MDIPSTKMLGDILIEWIDSGERAILMTSHQVEDIRKLSDYLAILHNGSLRGSFEKDALMEHFRRYWVKGDLPQEKIPGEISRKQRQLTTDDPRLTEAFFNRHHIEWYDREAMDLEDIITILMTRKDS